MKPVRWAGGALRDIKRFPMDAKREAGYQISRVQEGLQPDDWKPMPGIGPGVEEIRIHAGGEHRIVYVSRFQEAVYVLHCFAKKTQRTTAKDIETAKARLALVIKERR